MKAAVPLILVSGSNYGDREAAIAESIKHRPAKKNIAVILEGLPDGEPRLENSPDLLLHRIAPGCFCCIGNLALRVTLNRLLRQHPACIYLSVASSAHLDNILLTLQQTPYDQLLLAESPIYL